jgi:hypothetical protein
LVQFQTKIIRFPDEKVHALIVDTRNQGYPAKVHTRNRNRQSGDPESTCPE